MIHVGIVGHESAKFTPKTEAEARKIIRGIILDAQNLDEDVTVVSGHCHLGGIDIWAEEEADTAGVAKLIFPPKRLGWEGGYKQRNIQIYENSDEVHCIVVKEYPINYSDMRFNFCYHCNTNEHIKSGGCWVAKRSKKGIWHVI